MSAMRWLRWILLGVLGVSLVAATIDRPGSKSQPGSLTESLLDAGRTLDPLLDDGMRAVVARAHTLELDVEGARRLLRGGSETSAPLRLERARLALYEQRCDDAVVLLEPPGLEPLQEAPELLSIARGCARAMASTLRVEDPERGVVVQLHDEDDLPLVPWLFRVAASARELFERELGVVLPSPVRVVLVRDQLTLAAMTGLPLESAQTTGTVAVAKWGRVTMLSPRVMGSGYAWLDTLVHELTHLALTQATRDKAPLWLQEGVAKREESRWRRPDRFDAMPSADSMAAYGLVHGLGRPIDKLGPSIAMLPTAEEAQVAYAEVESFLDYWLEQSGNEALPQLLLRIKSSRQGSAEELAQAIQEVSGRAFSDWDRQWREVLPSRAAPLSSELAPGGQIPFAEEASRRLRLGDLLGARGQHAAAALELEQAQRLVPRQASVRSMLSASLLEQGRRDEAQALVASLEAVDDKDGRYLSLHARLWAPADTADLLQAALAVQPLDPAVACEELAAPELPREVERAALCDLARRLARPVAPP